MDASQRAGLAFGMGTASLMMTVLGFFWLGWAISEARMSTPIPWPILYVAFLAMLAAAIQSVRKGKALVRTHVAAHNEFWPRVRGPFRTITAIEGAGCAIVVVLVVALHRLDLLGVGISLVVGLHFLPLGRLFRVPVYYAVGTAIIVCDVLAWAFLRSDAITVAVGLTTGLILWATAVYALLRARRNVREITRARDVLN